MSEDFNDWQQQQRVQQERWDYATSSGQYAPKPSPSAIDWSSPASPSVPQSTGGSDGSYGGYYQGSSGGGPTIFSIVPWIPALPVLYPLPFAVAFAGAGVGYGVLESLFEVYTSAGRNGLAAASLLIGLVLFFATSRLDHRLAASALWRVPRHALRLAVMAGIGYLVAAALLQGPDRSTGASLDVSLLGNPVVLASLAAWALAGHILLTRDRLREWWHERLAAAYLRKAD